MAQQYQPEPVQSVLFSDNFANLSQWSVGTNTIDHTIFGQTPTLVSSASGTYQNYAQLKFDTYDPAQYQGGVSFLGTQIQTKQTFSLPTSGGVDTGQGIQFQISARVEATGERGPQGNSNDSAVPIPQGLNAASFTYSYSSSQNYHDEIDFENLTAQQTPPSTVNPNGATAHSNSHFGVSNGDATLDTSYRTTTDGGNNNSYYSQYPFAPKDAGPATPPVDIYQWNTYDIVWYPNQIDWYINGQLVREEANGDQTTVNPAIYVPNEPMAFYVNFWAPGSEFSDAYSAGLTPSASAASNSEFYDDIADASVSVVAAPGTPVPEPVGIASLTMAGLMLLGKRRCRKT